MKSWGGGGGGGLGMRLYTCLKQPSSSVALNEKPSFLQLCPCHLREGSRGEAVCVCPRHGGVV